MGDPRWAQIFVLSGLAAWGFMALDFGFAADRAALTVATAFGVQALGNHSKGEPFEWRSALISSLSLILLLRSGNLGMSVAAAAIAVGSKFLLRVRGRHVFNPTNLALVVLLLATDTVWVSSGQWGSGPVAVASCAAAAFWVLPRVRGDVTIAFVVFWSAMLFGRALSLGDPLAIPLHQLSSGTLFVFAAFMLSDPRTIPNSRAGRVLFAGLVASGGYIGRFAFYEPNALLYSLAGAALLVPLIDFWFGGSEFRWPGRTPVPETLLSKKNGKEDDARFPTDPPISGPARKPGWAAAAVMRSGGARAHFGTRVLRVLRREGRYEALQ